MVKKPEKDPDSKVGYKKPPKATQFVKGKSGNPSGRKKGSKNIQTLLDDALDAKIIINEGKSGRRHVTKREAMILQMVNKALSGDPRILKILLSMAMPEGTKSKEPELTTFTMDISHPANSYE